MNGLITEQTYRIEPIWLTKSLLLYVLRLVLVGSYVSIVYAPLLTDLFTHLTRLNTPLGWFFLFMIFTMVFPFDFVVALLRRANYHYSLEAQFLVLKQGVLSKQERQIPYGVIQNIFVQQDFMDRILGIAALSIENAAAGGGAGLLGALKANNNTGQASAVGFSGNQVNIPGLTKANAELLKNALLEKVKANPLKDTQSGL